MLTQPVIKPGHMKQMLDHRERSKVMNIVVGINLQQRILGGVHINIEEAPHSVNYGDRCGGVIVAKNWILTAAHCGFLSYIRFGSKYRLKNPKVLIKRHLVHPYFGQGHQFSYDIQLLEIPRSLHFSKFVRSVPLWDGCEVTRINASGWGFEKEADDYVNILKQVEMEVVSKNVCQNIDQFMYNHSLTEEMFCAGNTTNDACQGDSGVGATVGSPGHQQLVGTASFGYGCGRLPGVYINTSAPAARDWIQAVTGLNQFGYG